MYYKRPSLKTDWLPGRTEAYRGTVMSKTDPDVIAMKADIAENNAFRRQWNESLINRQLDYGMNQEEIAEQINALMGYQSLNRVRFMARGPRRNADGSVIHINADSCLNHKHATHYDVYVHEDTTAVYAWKQRMIKEYAPLVAEREELEWRLMQIKWDLKRND